MSVSSNLQSHVGRRRAGDGNWFMLKRGDGKDLKESSINALRAKGLMNPKRGKGAYGPCLPPGWNPKP